MTKEARLAAIAGRITRYEIVAENGDQRLLIGYTPRVSRQGMLDAARSIGQRVIDRLAISDSDIVSWTGKGRLGHRMEFTNGWTVRFTGRTEREAIIEGELERV